MVFVFFIYGLAFFSLGLSVAIYPKAGSSFRLAENLRLMAAFGILHGFTEWSDMAILIEGASPSLQVAKAVLLTVSFFVIFKFGTSCLGVSTGRHYALRAAPLALLFLWAAITLFSKDRFLMAQIWGRYLLGAPGIFLTAAALFIKSKEFSTDLSNTRLYLIYASLAFGFYGAFAGLVVPEADFFPASLVNYRSFTGLTGFPVQILRAACAVVISYCMVRTLRIFDWETKEALRKARDELDARVRDRTAELVKSKDDLEREIAERKVLEGGLKASEKKYRDLVDNSLIGIFVTATRGDVLYANEALLRLFGYGSPSEIMAAGAASAYKRKEDRDNIIKELREKGKVSGFETDMLTKGGEARHVLVSASLEGDTISGMIMDITEQKLSSDRLRASLREKELLLKEIHHRVKNNLQVISSLLRLQSYHVKDKEDMFLFEESRNRIRSMALVHENLYGSEDLANIDMHSYVARLCSNLQSSFGSGASGVAIDIDVEDVKMGIDTAIPCGLIINELVSNSLKHAFGGIDRGNIRISMKRDAAGVVEVVVSDNGMGLPEGFDINEVDTMGLQLVSTLAEQQLGGVFSVEADGGPVFRLRFPEPDYIKRI